MLAAAAMMEMEVLKDRKLVVSLVVRYATLSRPNKGATRRLVMSLFFGKGQARADVRPAHCLPREVMASKTKESAEALYNSVILSFPVLTRLVCNLA